MEYFSDAHGVPSLPDVLALFDQLLFAGSDWLCDQIEQCVDREDAGTLDFGPSACGSAQDFGWRRGRSMLEDFVQEVLLRGAVTPIGGLIQSLSQRGCRRSTKREVCALYSRYADELHRFLSIARPTIRSRPPVQRQENLDLFAAAR